MPELPEVETITNALKHNILGKKFTRIEIFAPKLRYELTLHKEPNLLNTKIINVSRRARYTIIEFENLHALIFHYGMTGSVRICSTTEPRLKHEHVYFHLNDRETLRFEDTRRFGYILHGKLSHKGATPDCLNHLGPEPLTDAFNPNYLLSILKKKKTNIKTAIMDNLIVVGVGNIYANESLFKSGISPQKRACDLTKKERTLFVANIKSTLKEAIKAGGTTIADFKGVDGQEGKFALQLNVYGRQGENCVTCQSKIEKITQGGRATFFCPKCQK